MEIAIYGKGGIGKSTISANISASLAKKGMKILQVGCDPKQDSTRLLLNGSKIPSVLEYIKDISPDKYSLEDIVFEGYKGVHCVEAGGPKPGVGCAGRGILTTFELLDKLLIKDKNYDNIIYDVLGDVVCGGFAVPMRREYAKKIYIVSSGEFMSIYAANNILKGIKNYDGNINRVGGIIYNVRGLKDEDERMERFSKAVKLPIVARIPRDEIFAKSEKNLQCVVEYDENSYVSKIFDKLAETIVSQNVLYKASPLDTDLLEEKVLLTGKAEEKKLNSPYKKEKEYKKDYKEDDMIYSKNVLYKEPLHGCAYSGAAGVTTQIKESATISHGPNSCAHITYQNITSLARRTLLERAITLPIQTSPPFYSSEMDENVMIFGGIDNLLSKVEEVKKNKVKVIFILTTCPSGIIGENIDEVKSLEESGIKIVPIMTEGNISGDYLQGIFMAYKNVCKNIIDRNIKPDKRYVNIVAEKPIASTTNINFKFVEDILNQLELKVNCRLINNTNYDDIKNFLKGDLNILAYKDYMARNIKDFLEKEYKCKFLENSFPVGYDDSLEFVRSLCSYYNKEDKFNEIISKYNEIYDREISRYKEKLKGKKVVLFLYNQDIDWVLKTIIDLGMDIKLLGVIDYSQEDKFTTRYMDYIEEYKFNYNEKNRKEDILRTKTDIVLTNYSSPELGKNIFSDTIPLSPQVGFFSGLYFAKRWNDFFDRKLEEGWKKDEELFKKYFS